MSTNRPRGNNNHQKHEAKESGDNNNQKLEVKERSHHEYHDLLTDAEQKKLTLDDVIIKGNPNMTADEIMAAFNEGLKEKVLVNATIRTGWVTPPGVFSLAYKNRDAELSRSINGARIVKKWVVDPRVPSELLAQEIPQNSPCYGAYGKYVVNVRFGHYAKIWDGNTPKLLGPGIHIIKSNNFRYGDRRPEDGIDVQSAEVSQTDSYIEHGTIHIIRPKSGEIARVMVNNEPLFLDAQPEPYVFTSPIFHFNPKKDFIDQNEPYIVNGTKHRLRINDGYVATITVGTERRIEEAGTYEYENPFSLNKTIDEETGEETSFRKTGDHLIEHGPLKRILPGINEVAVTNNNGKLEIVDGYKLITDPKHTVKEWVNTSVQTFEFPSERTIEKHKKDKVSDANAAFELFMTRDSMQVGVKLLVAYQIADPHLALKKLGSNRGISDHIEGVVTSDMNKAIQKCTSQEFLASNKNKPGDANATDNNSNVNNNKAEKEKTYQDEVRDILAKDLKEYGIELIRMNVQESKLMDDSIAKEMSKSVISSATAYAKQATMQQENAVAQNLAQQKANVARIEVERENQNQIAKAQAKLEASKREAEAILTLAKAEAEATLARKKAEVEGNELQAKMYSSNPFMKDIRKTEIIADAIKQSKFFVGTGEFNALLQTGLFATSLRSMLDNPIKQQNNNNADSNVVEMHSPKPGAVHG